VLKNAGIQDVWIKSSKLTAKKIDLETKKNNISYVAAHVDGNDISDIPDNVKNIAKIFSGKNGISKVLMTVADPKAIDMLYPGKQKDVWNKADIVLIANNLDIV
jgi:Leucine-rich repeat (LRR) protein